MSNTVMHLLIFATIACAISVGYLFWKNQCRETTLFGELGTVLESIPRAFCVLCISFVGAFLIGPIADMSKTSTVFLAFCISLVSLILVMRHYQKKSKEIAR